MANAIVFDRVSKHYRRTSGQYAALRDDLTAGLRRIAGKRRPSAASVLKALDDVSFTIAEGESTALVGNNGAGKTTALKLATRVAWPSSGRLTVRGRVGALIEVGTGLHPELSGRENVALFGRILGISRTEIGRNFEAIVDFAGVGAAVDQPVKQYSSGMQLRLGFAIAAHLEPDILIVDEAIAVGDAGFQYKCVERMRSLVNEGRTLVFVSHDMSAVETLCSRAILLEHGRVALDASAKEVVRHYLSGVQKQQLETRSQAILDGNFGLSILSVDVLDHNGQPSSVLDSAGQKRVRITYDAELKIEHPIFSVGFSDGRLGCFAMASMLVDGNTPPYLHGKGTVECHIENLELHPKTYEVWGSVRGAAGFGDIVDWQKLAMFRVDAATADGLSAVTHTMTAAPVVLNYTWHF